MNQIKIRNAEERDVEQLTQFGVVLLKIHSDLDSYYNPVEKVGDIYRTFLERSLNSPNKRILVAEKEGRLVGYAVAEIQLREKIFHTPKNGYINDVFVEKGFRQYGIARKFLREFKEWFQTKNVQYIELAVHAKNDLGKKTWAKFGFEPYEIKERVELEKFKVS